MAKIELDSNALQVIDQSSFTPETKEYEQGDWTALFQQMNTGGSLYYRGYHQNKAVDLTPVQDQEFNLENMSNYIRSTYGNTIAEQVLISPHEDWESAIRRAEYVKGVNKQSEQINENFSTAGMLAAGIPMALIDIDAPLLAAGTKAVNTSRKLLNMSLASRMAKTANYSVQGGVTGAIAMSTYEASQGIYREDSVLNATLIGLGLGGTLGYFASRAEANPNLINDIDGKTGKALTAEESKLARIEAANAEKKIIDEVIEEAEGIRAEAGVTRKEATRSEINDRGRVRFDKGLKQQRLNEEKGFAKSALDGARELLKTAQNGLSAVQKEIRDLTGTMNRARKDSVAETQLITERKAFEREASPVKGQITKLKNQYAKLKGQRGAEITAQRKLIKDKLAAQEAKLAKIEAKITRVDTKLGKLLKEPNKIVKEGMVRLGGLRTSEMEASKAYDLAKADKGKADTAYRAKVQEARDFSTQVRKEDVPKSIETINLENKEQLLRAALTGEGLKKLFEKRNALDEDLAKMANDDFDLSALYGIRREKKNYIDKLGKELEELQNVKDLTTSPTFKRLPEWARKLVISPIERALNSDNQWVSGFAQLLHSGTTYHGKIRTHNAWNVRTMLDNQVNRMHKAVTFGYHEAVKNGAFTGKLEAWDAAVSKGVYEVTGAMQKEMTTGIDGSIVGKERFEIARKKAATIQRRYASDNKYLNKAINEVLDYYESIYAKGNALGMEAFSGIGKGYAKRIYNTQKFKEMGEQAVVDMLVEAQRAKAIATNSLITPAIRDEWEQIARGTYRSVVNGDFRREQLTIPLGMPRQSTATSLKQRTVEAYDDDIIDLLEHDFRSTTMLYGLNTHGRLALKEKLGVDNDEQLMKMLDQLAENGATSKEILDLKVVIETIKGTREVSKNPFDPFTRAVKGASTISSAMHTLAFAIPTLTEVASISKEFGWSKTIDGLVGKPSEIYSMYRYGTPSEKNTIEMMVSYGDAHFAQKANRFDVESTYDSVGKFQEFMDDVVRREAVFGGLLPLTDMLRMTTASLSVDFLARMSVAKKISKTDEMRLNDMGFGLEDMARIRDTLKVAEDGRIGVTDRKKWGKLDEEITLGVMTMVERTILHPNGATLPKFMTNMNEGQFIPRVMMKFMRFPFESYERLLVRGIQEADAKQLLALGGNMAMWTAILAAKDALREDDKKMYDDEDGELKLMRDSFLYNSFTSLPVAGIDTLHGLAFGENLTNDYKYRVGGAVQSDWEKLQQGKLPIRVPFGTVEPVEAVNSAVTTMFGLEELNKE